MQLTIILFHYIERLLSSKDNFHAYLVERLWTDWEKLKNIWTNYKVGKINRKKLILLSIIKLGKKFVKNLL